MIQRPIHSSPVRSFARITAFWSLLALAMLGVTAVRVPQAGAQGGPVDCLAPPPRNQDLTLVAAAPLVARGLDRKI